MARSAIRKTDPPKACIPSPQYGLVCITFSNECRYRTTTRAAYLALPDDAARQAVLERIYWENINRFHAALSFCDRHDIRLYRVTSTLFPMSDEPIGDAVLRGYAALLSSIGRRAKRLQIRVVIHPDQFVVLSSDSPKVVQTSITILEKHALAFDLMGLPQSPWSLMNVHGGKAGRSAELVAAIKDLPKYVRSRLTLENDEYSFGAAEILDVCQQTGVPFLFDCHHHVIKEQLDDYDHPSVAKYTKLAAKTWPKPEWQVVHVSNGDSAFLDRYHSQHITMIPKAFRSVPWIEVEARGKELAIAGLRATWPTRATPPEGFPLRKQTAAQKREAADEE